MGNDTFQVIVVALLLVIAIMVSIIGGTVSGIVEILRRQK